MIDYLYGFSVDMNVEPGVAYYRFSSNQPMNGPPVERGIYPVIISYNRDARHMGASKRVELATGGGPAIFSPAARS